MIRVHGDVRRINLPPLDHNDVHAMVYDIMNDSQRKTYEEHLEVDFSFELPGPGALPRQRLQPGPRRRRGHPDHSLASALARGTAGARSVFAELSLKPRGLVLVTGPTGSGKSTTLAGMVNHVNDNDYGHVLTIEDPIEFVHESRKCLINQREVGSHTLSFANALRSALREDPDVVLVGELRDLETIRLALTAAETGHLVFGTLHTSSAAKTIDRVVDVFPGCGKGHGPLHALRVADRGDFAGADQAQGRQRARGGARDHDRHAGDPQSDPREAKVAQMYSVIQTGRSTACRRSTSA